MALSHEILSQFAKLVTKDNNKNVESTVYGTIVVDSNGSKYVKLDGSDQLTPLSDDERPIADSTTANANEGERVSVLIKNHTATVTGNVSSPAARTGDVEELGDQVSSIQEFDILIGERVEANEGYIKTLQTDKASVAELVASEAKITELVAEKASIEELNAVKATVDDLEATKIDTEVVNANFATIKDLEATNADITQLKATNIEVTNKLTAAEADIDNLEANKIDASEVEARYATIEKLEAGYATIDDLKATNANVTNLTADVADIDTLIFGSASGTTIQTSFANAVIAQLGNAQIKSAMIENISASQISAGDIITNNVRVMSEDGSLLISDETIQISDDTRVRVQIGKDAANDYSINIWDADGNLMFSEGGITDSAIKDAIIRNDMVASDANIAASKLDISSLFTEINNSTETINSNKVLIDTDAGTLDVAFTKMETDISGLSDDVSSQGTALSVVQGQISSKVWQQDIDTAIEDVDADVAEAKDGVTTLTTKYSSLEQTVDGISSTVGEHTTQIANKADSSEVTAVNDKVTTLEQSVDGFKTEVSETYATKTALTDTQDDISAIEERVSTAETSIEQNKNDITLRATKTELETVSDAAEAAQSTADGVKTDLAENYYTKSETDAQIKVSADNITLSVSSTYATKTELTDAQGDISALEERVSTAETAIEQNTEDITLRATKTELETVSSAADNTQNAVTALQKDVATLKVKDDEIVASVSSVQTTVSSVSSEVAATKEEVASLKLTSNSMQVAIDTINNDGVSKVSTTTGTFDESGLTIDRTDSTTKTQVTPDGMTVYAKGRETTAVLTATSSGVDATNLHAKTYLIIGGRSRFENYGDNRTGCFWIGGN